MSISANGAQVYLITPDTAGMRTPFAHALRQVPGITVLERYQVKEIVGATSVEYAVSAYGYLLTHPALVEAEAAD